MTRALLGLGGNIGDPEASMRGALRNLHARRGIRVVSVSRLFRTPPWGKIDQPPFLNAAARLETSLGPRDLLAVCLDVERGLKRERIERWGPRTIDLDILDMEGRAFHDDHLTLPHPRMADRAFVLAPLMDVAPDMPVGGRPIAEVLEALDRSGIEAVGADGDWWR